MAKYRMAMTAFGLGAGDTFESSDPGWADRAKAGFVVEVDDSTPVNVLPDPPVELSDDEYEARVAAGDPVLVKPGEIRREQVPAQTEEEALADATAAAKAIAPKKPKADSDG